MLSQQGAREDALDMRSSSFSAVGWLQRAGGEVVWDVHGAWTLSQGMGGVEVMQDFA